MLLLLFVTRHARLQAVQEASARDAEKQSGIAAEMEMVQWRVEQLRTSRKETEAQLTEARLELGHIEDHGRRLRGQFEQLSQQAKKAADEGLRAGRFVAAGEEELRQVEGQLAEAQQELVQAQQAAGNRPKSYAIVPYDGFNRTRRRPIYIECRGDAVVIQPENIVFNEVDFDEPLGPGNPLAAAIRATREQMLLQGGADPQNTGEPYPLLLVRPDGIAAYDAALAAMKSWGSEFGYELISQDWQLKYPPPNPNLAKAVTQARDLARQEHARLIAAAPSKYGKRPRVGSLRTPTASEVAEQEGMGDGGNPGFYSSKPSGQYGRNSAGGSSGRGGQGGGSGGSGGSGNGHGSGSGSGLGSGGDGPDSDAELAANNPYAAIGVPGQGGSPGVGPGGVGIGNGYGPGNGIPGGGRIDECRRLRRFAGCELWRKRNWFRLWTRKRHARCRWFGRFTRNVCWRKWNWFRLWTGERHARCRWFGRFTRNVCWRNRNWFRLWTRKRHARRGALGGSPGMYAGGNGTGSGYGPGGGSPGAVAAGSGLNNGPGSSPGTGLNNGSSGSPGAVAAGSAANNGAYQANGQQSGVSSGTAGVARPDGYINGRPNDASSPSAPVRPDPTSTAAMAPVMPLLPGEWRPEPPKPDRDQEEKEKNEKKKHPYDKVKIDHSLDDWALRNAGRHAAAISRPIHVDCLADRIVLVPEAGSEPHIIFLGSGGQRDADKIVAGVWEIMDSWGMAGREMYWRPILHFYVVPGGESRMQDLTRSLQGSGLVIERKQ